MEDQKNLVRGYDDTALLKEMADGIVTRRYGSVDEAAKAVLGNSPVSNADRLRRKFREQNWYERGLNDYVEAELQRRMSSGPLPHPAEPAAAPIAVTSASPSKRPFLRTRVSRWAAVAAVLAAVVTAPFAVTQSGASEDPVRVAARTRATTFATDAFKGLFDLDFADPEAQINRNIRFFLAPGAFNAYVDRVKGSGLDRDVRRGLLVLRNEVVSVPKTGEWLEGYTVNFDVRRAIHTSTGKTDACYKAEVFVVRNDNATLGSAEFGLVGPPRVVERRCPG